MKRFVFLLLALAAIIEIQLWYQSTKMQIMRMDIAVAKGDIHRLDRMADLKFQKK